MTMLDARAEADRALGLDLDDPTRHHDDVDDALPASVRVTNTLAQSVQGPVTRRPSIILQSAKKAGHDLLVRRPVPSPPMGEALDRT